MVKETKLEWEKRTSVLYKRITKQEWKRAVVNSISASWYLDGC